MKEIMVADVEYNDDDGYDVHVLMAVDADTTEEELEEYLSYTCGYIGIYVNEFKIILVEREYDKYDVVEVLD